MYAIVHPQAEPCSHVLQDVGFDEVLVRPPPVRKEEIQDDYLRNHIHTEWCCGSDEFVKLYAYTLPEPVVVHLDIDFVMHRPMDTLLDVLLYDKDSVIGRRARAALEVERTQSADEVIPLPDQPQAAMTRDWGQVLPGYKPLYQAGFIAARTNPQVTVDVANIVRTEKYIGEISRSGGWGGMGYVGYVGAMAMQGLLAFYYDQHAADQWIELNQCNYNHMGMDVKVSPKGPSFLKKHQGKCRNNSPYCEDCRNTPVDQIYNVHYTLCRKPWTCIGASDEGLNKKPRQKTALEKQLIPQGLVYLDHCLELNQIWHDHRSDLEAKLQALVNNAEKHAAIDGGRNGTYMAGTFQGHCSEFGFDGYLQIASGNSEVLKFVKDLY